MVYLFRMRNICFVWFFIKINVIWILFHNLCYIFYMNNEQIVSISPICSHLIQPWILIFNISYIYEKHLNEAIKTIFQDNICYFYSFNQLNLYENHLNEAVKTIFQGNVIAIHSIGLTYQVEFKRGNSISSISSIL